MEDKKMAAGAFRRTGNYGWDGPLILLSHFFFFFSFLFFSGIHQPEGVHVRERDGHATTTGTTGHVLVTNWRGFYALRPTLHKRLKEKLMRAFHMLFSGEEPSIVTFYRVIRSFPCFSICQCEHFNVLKLFCFFFVFCFFSLVSLWKHDFTSIKYGGTLVRNCTLCSFRFLCTFLET